MSSSALAQHPTRIDTRDMTIEKWLDLRRTYIGGSDAAAVVGKNPFKTPYALWCEKTGAVPPLDLSENEAVQLGLKLEDWVAQEFSERSGLRVQRDNCIRVHPQYPFIACNLDRRVVGEAAVLQCKIAGANAAFGDEWGEGPDEVPQRYLVQVQHEMLVTGLRKAYLAVLLASTQFKIYEIFADDIIAEVLVRAHSDFWNHVEANEPPAITTMEDARRAYPTSRSIVVEATEEVVAACDRIAELKARAKDTEASIESLQAVVCAHMGDADELQYAGKKLATWRTSERAGYTVAPTTTRIFRLSQSKK